MTEGFILLDVWVLNLSNFKFERSITISFGHVLQIIFILLFQKTAFYKDTNFSILVWLTLTHFKFCWKGKLCFKQINNMTSEKIFLKHHLNKSEEYSFLKSALYMERSETELILKFSILKSERKVLFWDYKTIGNTPNDSKYLDCLSQNFLKLYFWCWK